MRSKKTFSRGRYLPRIQATHVTDSETALTLTPTMRRTLEYLAQRAFVIDWPIEMSGKRTHNQLLGAGFMEVFGKSRVRYRITEAGRKAVTK